MFKKIITSLIIFFFANKIYSMKIEVPWGEVTIEDQLTQDLINSKIMQRIKHVDQSGPPAFCALVPKFSRYDHSIGVYALLKRFKVSYAEQLAGLLHDSSHTAFSHIGDNLFFREEANKSYQDVIHMWFLNQMNLSGIISNSGLLASDFNPDKPEYKALEAELPDMCADRIEYNLHTALITKKLSQNDVIKIVNDLNFDGDKWYFSSEDMALKFAYLPLEFNKQIWGSYENTVLYEKFSQLIKKSMSEQIISAYDLHFSDDQSIIDKLSTKLSKNIIQDFCKHAAKNNYKIVSYGKGEINKKPKFRGIDPLVKVDGRLQRLSFLNPHFKKEFDKVKKWCEQGYGILFKI